MSRDTQVNSLPSIFNVCELLRNTNYKRNQPGVMVNACNLNIRTVNFRPAGVISQVLVPKKAGDV